MYEFSFHASLQSIYHWFDWQRLQALIASHVLLINGSFMPLDECDKVIQTKNSQTNEYVSSYRSNKYSDVIIIHMQKSQSTRVHELGGVETPLRCSATDLLHFATGTLSGAGRTDGMRVVRPKGRGSSVILFSFTLSRSAAHPPPPTPRTRHRYSSPFGVTKLPVSLLAAV